MRFWVLSGGVLKLVSLKMADTSRRGNVTIGCSSSQMVLEFHFGEFISITSNYVVRF